MRICQLAGKVKNNNLKAENKNVNNWKLEMTLTLFTSKDEMFPHFTSILLDNEWFIVIEREAVDKNGWS